jgi:hypothetical protein
MDFVEGGGRLNLTGKRPVRVRTTNAPIQLCDALSSAAVWFLGSLVSELG